VVEEEEAMNNAALIEAVDEIQGRTKSRDVFELCAVVRQLAGTAHEDEEQKTDG
jgi:hypothetical protein